MMEKEYTCKNPQLGRDEPAIRLGRLGAITSTHEIATSELSGETVVFGPAAEKLYAYEELGYSPKELRKIIEEYGRLKEMTAKVSDEKLTFHVDYSRFPVESVTTTNLPSPKPNPITKVYNMVQMEQYFTDRNIKVIRKWNKCGTDTRYTFTLTYAGITQDYYFTYPDAVVYEERSKPMTKFCEGAYNCFDKYVRDNVRVTYMPARQNGKSLIDAAEMFNYIDTDIAIQKRLYDSVFKWNVTPKELAEMADKFAREYVVTPAEMRSCLNHATTPAIKDVIFNDPATIVFWNDGTKTVVRAQGEAFDPEKGLAMAFAKKMFGNNHDYYIQFKRWLKKAKKGPESKKLEAK